MVFNSLHFAAFFLAFLGLYRLLPHRGQNWLLVAGSYYFYASWDWRFLGLLIVSTLTAYTCGVLFGRLEDEKQRKLVLVAGLGVHLALLGFFKYFGFFAENLQALLGLAGLRPGGFTLQVLLPVGISFYTFIAMSYVIDVYRRQIGPSRSLVDVAAFIGFFPTLLAGPIVRASSLLRQIREPRSPTGAQAAEGAWLMLWGFFKKMFVADNLAHVVNQVYAADTPPGGLAVVLATVAFAFQIYGDFSGYSDIARGLSKLLGIELMVNFRFPYFVRTPQEFWTHWHISLSEWLRDYLFLPLSFAFSRRLDGVRWLGLRDDVWIYAAATLVTMLLAGLWHGAAWTFVAWGLYHGALLVLERTRAGTWIGRTPGPVQHAYLVLAVMGGWVLFRLDTLRQAGWFLAVLAGLTGGGGAPIARYAGGDVLVAAAVGIVLSTRLAQATGARARAWLQRATATAPVVLVVGDAAMQAALLLLSLAWLSAGTYTPFIYFRF